MPAFGILRKAVGKDQGLCEAYGCLFNRVFVGLNSLAALLCGEENEVLCWGDIDEFHVRQLDHDLVVAAVHAALAAHLNLSSSDRVSQHLYRFYDMRELEI